MLQWFSNLELPGLIIEGGPTIAGAAKSMTTTTLQSEIYAFLFDQKGLMGGLGLQGTKITKIKK